jgi:hypothetical protein
MSHKVPFGREMDRESGERRLVEEQEIGHGT